MYEDIYLVQLTGKYYISEHSLFGFKYFQIHVQKRWTRTFGGPDIIGWRKATMEDIVELGLNNKR